MLQQYTYEPLADVRRGDVGDDKKKRKKDDDGDDENNQEHWQFRRGHTDTVRTFTDKFYH